MSVSAGRCVGSNANVDKVMYTYMSKIQEQMKAGAVKAVEGFLADSL